MKTNKHVLRIAVLSTVFALGIGLAAYLTAPHKKLDAEDHNQHNSNYDPYTYEGDYYDGFVFTASGGMNGDLRTSLSTKIRPLSFYEYSGNEAGTLSEQLQEADEDPTNHNNMVMFYTRDSRTKVWANPGPGTSSATEVWNREHVWCQSLSNNNWGEKKGGTDILHLRPTYKTPNSTRNNHPYGNVQDKVAKEYEGMFYGYLENHGDLFEPLDCVKGDVARIIMYVWTAYTDYPNYNPLYITDVFESFDTLLQWHTMDRPDALEGHRNDWAEHSDQQNRNPFVDHPELAWKIFGDAAEHSSYKEACMAAYPDDSTPINPTSVELNRTTASVVTGSTVQLTATIRPIGATGTVTWSSNNTGVATVTSTGLVTGFNPGTATITARVNENISANCVVTVTEPANYVRIASYDLSTDTSSTTAFINAELYSHLSSCAQSGIGLSNIITGVSGSSKVYRGQANYTNFGLKLGSSGNSGTFTVALNTNVSRVVVNTAGWTVNDSLTVGDAAAQTPGVAYTGTNPIKTLTYDITASNSVTFLYQDRGYIQSIDFYTIEEPVDVPTNYLDTNATFATIYGNEITSVIPNLEYSITFASLGLQNTVQYTDPFEITDGVTIRFTGGSNDGRYYNTGSGIRTYGNGSIIIESDEALNRIVFSWDSPTDNKPSSDDIVNTGSYDHSTYIWTGNANSVTLTRPNGSGHWRLKGVTVNHSGETQTVETPFLRFGMVFTKANWESISSQWTIEDYGVMLVKETTLQNTYHEESVEAAYRHNRTLSIQNVNSGDVPQSIDENNYMISVRINMTDTQYRGITYCASPFIVINGEYYFLGEIHSSFNDTLDECLNHDGMSILSHNALLTLKTNNN